jgi:hypothetical protein
MKILKLSAPITCLIRTNLIPLGVFLIITISGCSKLSIESAKELGSAGQEVSGNAVANIFVSDEEYQQAMDAEQLFHGFAGIDVPQQLSDDYETIQTELASRKIVFKALGDVYSEFEKLASIDTATGVETAINGLGDAVNKYASTQHKSAVISKSAQGVIAKVVGLIAKEVQKEKIQESSALIRERLSAFQALFSDPLVKNQLTSFKQTLAQNRSSAINLLWKKGVYDPSPLIDEMGAEAGLKANKDVLNIVNDKKDARVKNGLEKVITARLQRKIRLVEKSYDANVNAVAQLIAKHEKLEKGEELNLATLRQYILELRLITDTLAPAGSIDNK